LAKNGPYLLARKKFRYVQPDGPWIDTGLSQADLAAMETIIRLNGKESYRFRTNDMVFSVSQHIAAMTKYVTLYPGDVIWMGTDGESPIFIPATWSRWS